MHIAANHVVSIHYTLKNDDGAVIDTSAQMPPLEYLQGAGNIVVGLERALMGKSVGDKFSVTVEPEDGYGEFRAELVQVLPTSMFAGVDQLEVGMAFHAQLSDGKPHVVEITEVDGDEVTINGNPPLAGQRLHFDVEVVAVRDASEQEQTQGHPDGIGEAQENEVAEEAAKEEKKTDCCGKCDP